MKHPILHTISVGILFLASSPCLQSVYSYNLTGSKSNNARPLSATASVTWDDDDDGSDVSDFTDMECPQLNIVSIASPFSIVATSPEIYLCTFFGFHLLDSIWRPPSAFIV